MEIIFGNLKQLLNYFASFVPTTYVVTGRIFSKEDIHQLIPKRIIDEPLIRYVNASSSLLVPID